MLVWIHSVDGDPGRFVVLRQDVYELLRKNIVPNLPCGAQGDPAPRQQHPMDNVAVVGLDLALGFQRHHAIGPLNTQRRVVLSENIVFREVCERLGRSALLQIIRRRAEKLPARSEFPRNQA